MSHSEQNKKQSQTSSIRHEYWVIEHKGRVEALLNAQDERDAKRQAIWWARGRINKGVLWRNIVVRPHSSQPHSRGRRLPQIPKLQLSRAQNLHQPMLLVGLIGVLGWLWSGLI